MLSWYTLRIRLNWPEIGKFAANPICSSTRRRFTPKHRSFRPKLRRPVTPLHLSEIGRWSDSHPDLVAAEAAKGDFLLLTYCLIKRRRWTLIRQVQFDTHFRKLSLFLELWLVVSAKERFRHRSEYRWSRRLSSLIVRLGRPIGGRREEE